MNGIEKITARLIRDAQAEVDVINAEADAQCAAILAEYEAKAAEAYEKRIAKGKADCATRAERMAATADMEQRKALLAFKQALVSDAFEKAAEAVATLPREKYIEFFASLAADAAISGKEKLLFSESDKADTGAEIVSAANALLSAKGKTAEISLAEETVEVSGGFIMRSGNIEVNCTAETLVQLTRSSLSSQVAEILFS
ncbi:MAG: hypothetical protein IKC02_01545 [Oscillospiraceae bacterium]|nr:hypothetical protein [Oscillospiraceae bacterium]